MYQNVNLFIDGAWKPAASGKTLAVLNPATAEEIGTVAHAEKADLDAALAAAQKGFAAWRKVSPHDRYRLMRKAADIVRGRAGEIATLMTMEQGKPIAESKGETLAGADVIDWFAEEARRSYGRTIPPRADGVTGGWADHWQAPVRCRGAPRAVDEERDVLVHAGPLSGAVATI